MSKESSHRRPESSVLSEEDFRSWSASVEESTATATTAATAVSILSDLSLPLAIDEETGRKTYTTYNSPEDIITLGRELNKYFDPFPAAEIKGSQRIELVQGRRGFGCGVRFAARLSASREADEKRKSPQDDRRTIEELIEPQADHSSPYYYKCFYTDHLTSEQGIRSMITIALDATAIPILILLPTGRRNFLFALIAFLSSIFHLFAGSVHFLILFARVGGVFLRYKYIGWAYIRGFFYYFYMFIFMTCGWALLGCQQMAAVDLLAVHCLYIAAGLVAARYYLTIANREFYRARTKVPEERVNDPDGILARLENLNCHFQLPDHVRQRQRSDRKIGRTRRKRTVPNAPRRSTDRDPGEGLAVVGLV